MVTSYCNISKRIYIHYLPQFIKYSSIMVSIKTMVCGKVWILTKPHTLLLFCDMRNNKLALVSHFIIFWKRELNRIHDTVLNVILLECYIYRMLDVLNFEQRCSSQFHFYLVNFVLYFTLEINDNNWVLLRSIPTKTRKLKKKLTYTKIYF